MLKTIKASVINLTKRKKGLLDNDYNNYQWWMIFGIDNGLLSCFKATKRFKQKEIKYKNYPLPLWSYLIKNWFKCNKCEYEDNADRNASINIGKRGLSYMLGSGVVASALKSLAKSEGISTKFKVNSKLVALT